MPLTFRFAPLSKLLRAPGADWVVAVIAAAGVAALLGGAVIRHSPSLHPSPADLTLLGLALWSGVSGFFGVRSWRRLWRAGRTPAERFVYDFGVRGYGALMLILTPLLVVIVMVGFVDPVRSSGAWLLVLACAFMALMTSFPLWLWGGYVFGSIMSGMLPYRESAPRAAKDTGLPPAA